MVRFAAPTGFASYISTRAANSIRIITLRGAVLWLPEGDSVIYQDPLKPTWHPGLAKFLFTGEQLNQPVGKLSWRRTRARFDRSAHASASPTFSCSMSHERFGHPDPGHT